MTLSEIDRTEQFGKLFFAYSSLSNSCASLSFKNPPKSSLDQVMNNATTYTDIVITQEPAGDLSPLASWSNSVAQTWLLPPFGM